MLEFGLQLKALTATYSNIHNVKSSIWWIYGCGLVQVCVCVYAFVVSVYVHVCLKSNIQLI